MRAWRSCGVLTSALITGEEEQLVLDDLPADYTTELIAEEVVGSGAAARREE